MNPRVGPNGERLSPNIPNISGMRLNPSDRVLNFSIHMQLSEEKIKRSYKNKIYCFNQSINPCNPAGISYRCVLLRSVCVCVSHLFGFFLSTLGEAWAQLKKSLADEAEVHLKFSSKVSCCYREIQTHSQSFPGLNSQLD